MDAEHALDPEYAKKLGVDDNRRSFSQPDNGEQALEIVDMLVRSGALDLIVIDSVAALVPRAEIEGEMGDSHVGLQARLMSQALRKITSANQSKTTAIFINQLREKIGVMFGSPETTTGGRALKFYASVRIDIRRIETLKDGTDAVGNRTRCKVRQEQGRAALQAGRVRHPVRPRHQPRGWSDRHGRGARLRPQGRGAWYTYEGDQLGQGKENARNFLRTTPTWPTRSRRRGSGTAASQATGHRARRGRRLRRRHGQADPPLRCPRRRPPRPPSPRPRQPRADP
ncbi:recombinase RecA [Streptomyces violaceorubidus]